MAPISKTQLQDLVDSPNETLEAEYKEWHALSAGEARANLARHIAALANHGGGAIVFGFTDALQYAGPNTFLTVDRDLISSIIKKYLEPTFQCDVHDLISAGANAHSIVVVPPHGSAPICAKAGGPQVGGKPTGIVQGAYYVRKTGPESAAITTSGEWAPIIRRCAMHERSSILASIDAALRGNSFPDTATNALHVERGKERNSVIVTVQELKNAPIPDKPFAYRIEEEYLAVVAGASAAPATTPKLAPSRHQEILALLPAGWFTRKEGRKLVEPLLTGAEEARDITMPDVSLEP